MLNVQLFKTKKKNQTQNASKNNQVFKVNTILDNRGLL